MCHTAGAQMADYVFAQVEAGLVPLPGFGAAPVQVMEIAHD
jgi:hypothetical protein